MGVRGTHHHLKNSKGLGPGQYVLYFDHPTLFRDHQLAVQKGLRLVLCSPQIC